MTTTEYRLPDGTIVAIQTELARGAALIDFTLKDGRVVYAVRADIPMPKENTLNGNDRDRMD